MQRLTKEILQERSNQIHNNTYVILGEYINNSTKIEIKHLICGIINLQQPANHLEGKGCRHCSGSIRGTKEKLQENSNIKHNSAYEILGNYVTNETKIEIKHLVCNTIFSAAPNNHLSKTGCCPKCFKSIKSSKKELQRRSNEIHNSEYLILGKYINTDTKIKIKHKKCKSTFYQKPDKHLHNNKCPICYGNNKLTKEILQERSNKKYNSEYLILGDYINNSTPILIKHINCKSEYLQSPSNHLKERTCFKCRGNQSNGEKMIINYLDSKNIKYNFNNKLDGCTYGKKSLRFDFYLPEYNFCIEYDGEQHFKPISKFGGVEKYLRNIELDTFKNKWCEENNIGLFRISYKESIIDKLSNIFNI